VKDEVPVFIGNGYDEVSSELTPAVEDDLARFDESEPLVYQNRANEQELMTRSPLLLKEYTKYVEVKKGSGAR